MSRFHRKLATNAIRPLALAIATMSLLHATVSAIEIVRLEIVAAGDVGAFVIDGSLSDSKRGFIDLEVVDRRGSAAGWAVSILSSSELTVAALGPVLVLEGQDVVTEGPLTAGLVGMSLDLEHLIIRADRGAGSGSYAQHLITRPYLGNPEMLFTVTVGFAP